MKPEFEVGERVFVIYSGKPTTCTTVTEIKTYKRGSKVICEDGSEWDPQAWGRQWGRRSDHFYTGPTLAKSTPTLEQQWRATKAKSHVKWAMLRFELLTPEQQERLGALAYEIKKEHEA